MLQEKYEQLKALDRKDADEFVYEECADFFGELMDEDWESLAQMTWMAKKYKEYGMDGTIEAINSTDLSVNTKECLVETLRNCDSTVIALADNLTDDELEACTLFGERLDHSTNNSTPQMANLICRLIDTEHADSLLDLGFGISNVLIEAAENNENLVLDGVDESSKSISDCIVKFDTIGRKPNKLVNDDMFYYQPEEKYSRAVTQLIPHRTDKDELNNMKEILTEETGLDLGRTQEDWLAGLKLLSVLEDGGKGAALFLERACWRGPDSVLRKELIQRGYIKAVILMPAGLLKGSAVNTVLMIFDKSLNGQGVRMIDASALSRDRNDILSQDVVDEITRLMNKDSENSRLVSRDEILENNADLTVKKYLNPLPDIKNGQALEKFVKKSTRGMQKKITEYKANHPTSIIYLNASCLQDGYLDLENAEYLTDLPKSAVNFMLENGDILLSKNGFQIKSAVVEIPEDTAMIIGSNLIALELYEGKINPWYLQAWFASEAGKKCLANCTVGTAIPTVSLSQLMAMKVPVNDVVIQDDVETIYKANLNDLRVAKEAMETAARGMTQAYGEGTFDAGY